MWVLTGERERFCCIHIIGKSIRMTALILTAWPPLLRPEDFEEVVTVPEADAFAMARLAARTEGVFSGPSTGANVVAALQVAHRLGTGNRVVTVQVDSGLKYLDGPLYR